MKHEWKRDGAILRCARCGIAANPAFVDVETLPVDCGRREPAPQVHDCAAFVISHNYGRFLGEAIQSVLNQTFRPETIAVIDDASDDDTERVAKSFEGVEYHRVDFRNVHAARSFACELHRPKYVLFLDADNTLPATFIQSAIERMEADKSIAFTYPELMCFGGRTGSLVRMLPEVRFDDVATSNVCDAAAVYRWEILQQSLAMRRPIPMKSQEDWRVARDILASGPWRAVLNATPLNYRVHGSQMTKTIRLGNTYPVDADFGNETVTLVLTASGRWDLWPRRLQWLQSQKWPRDRLRLIVVDTSHESHSIAALGLDLFCCAGVSLYSHRVGRPGLSERKRRGEPETTHDVNIAVASIYNRVANEAQTEYLAIVEDDVFPEDPNWISRLMQGMGPRVAAVSGKYEHRFEPAKAVAFDLREPSGQKFRPMSTTGLQRVDGTGFGALVIRRSALRRLPLAADRQHNSHYDVEVGRQAKAAGWEWYLDADLFCEHMFARS